MHASISIATFLAITGAVFAAPAKRQHPAYYGLTVTNNANLTAWVVRNAHVAAAQNAITLQRPSAFTPDIVEFSGNSTNKEILFHLSGTDIPYGVVLNPVALGGVTQIFSEAGDSNAAAAFELDNDSIVKFSFQDEHFYACEGTVNGESEFVLKYGVGENKDDASCQPIDLLATGIP